METLRKIGDAIALIKKKNLKKKGHNTYSGYDYYTPEQVAELTTWACFEVGLITKFDLVRNELGITGKLSVYNTDSEESPVVYEMATDIPSIKATNVAQQLGGAVTYTKRYLLMNAFDIADNSLDFDTSENTKKQVRNDNKYEDLAMEIYKCLNESELKEVWDNNPELHKDKEFIKMINDAKKTLKK